MANWLQLFVFVGLFAWLLIVNTRITLVIIGVFAGMIVSILVLQWVKQKFPRIHEYLQGIGHLVVAGLIALIVIGGLGRSCSSPDSCSANEARFGGCN